MVGKFIKKYWWIFIGGMIYFYWSSENGLANNSIEFITFNQILKDTFTLVIAVLTIAIAFEGLTIWKKEIFGKFEFDLAKEIAIWISGLRNEILIMSSSWGTSAELKMNKKLAVIMEKDPRAIPSPFNIYKNPNYRMMITEFQTLSIKSKDYQLKAKLVWNEELTDIFSEIDNFCLKYQANFFRANFFIGDNDSILIDVEKYDEDNSLKTLLNIFNHSIVYEIDGDYVVKNYFDNYFNEFENTYEKLYTLMADKIKN
ncbi:hypothetical protein [Pelolinea submarina]|uniref:Uncharacterized protein n=1 Tax=Pelolinea submarina TaxID=913107 RepID=A0A347ZP48_9CHLR|nr:hypothetical protein [Pelolinea submarina]REG08681.1 hypothetical protein DFR64_2055 [Pelolinea submarina]BBB47079.1 hypothetical protein Pelsub_P0306 [Pelolinea submarina]